MQSQSKLRLGFCSGVLRKLARCNPGCDGRPGVAVVLIKSGLGGVVLIFLWGLRTYLLFLFSLYVATILIPPACSYSLFFSQIDSILLTTRVYHIILTYFAIKLREASNQSLREASDQR